MLIFGENCCDTLLIGVSYGEYGVIDDADDVGGGDGGGGGGDGGDGGEHGEPGGEHQSSAFGVSKLVLLFFSCRADI